MKKIHIRDAKPGMIIARTVLNENMIVVLSENTELTPTHIKRLNNLNILRIFIKDEEELQNNDYQIKSVLTLSNSFAEKYREVLSRAEELFELTAKNKVVETPEIKSFVADSVSPLAKEAGVIDRLYAMKAKNYSVYTHSVRVSVLSGVLAKWLNYNEEFIQETILAGFLHDIGKTQIDQSLLLKCQDEYSPAEFDEYIRHTREGYSLLCMESELSNNVKCAALQHHEHMNGTGHPMGFTNMDINDCAKIVATVNIYDNITSERPGFKHQTPFDALSIMTDKMHDIFDPGIVIPFINNIRQAFLGSSVTLSNDMNGRIISFRELTRPQPLVQLENGEVVDLGSNQNIAIVEYNPVV